MIKIVACISILFFFADQLIGQEVWMHPNAGQWDDRIEFKIDLQLGEMFIEKDGFTYFLNNSKEIRHSHHDHHDEIVEDDKYQVHVIKSKFVGSSWSGKVNKIDSSMFYNNYILGNDPSKWYDHLYSYSQIEIADFYDGIDLILDGKNDNLKYALKLDPNIDANQIIMRYNGQDKIYIDEEGNLHLTNRFGDIIEERPIAWTVDTEGNEINKVNVRFKISGNDVSFIFPEGYDATQSLVIDPNITFSTFTGSTADNWGMSATPDIAGNLFGGGVAFGSGYPYTAGAYDASFNGGTVDIAITKFTANGASLLYSTYLGGSGSETPNSMICAPNGELYIFGLTSSPNFPMAGAPYDASYNGGPNVSASANGLGFTGGTDLYIARLSANGASVLSSTYIGGSSTDGLNTGSLNYNYGDQFRGEIILDDIGNVFVASSTQSSNFPTNLGPQNTLSGTQDAVVFKMPPTLNALTWSGYFGGTGLETGNSVQISSTGDVYFSGGTTSNTLALVTGQDLTFNGGAADGYVTRLNGATGAIISGSFMGLGEYDQTYCVQLDLDDNVYVLGQSQSSWPITAGLYGVPNSGQFIRKYNTNLTSILWTTMVGAGTGNVEISPTAFLVSDCYDIYFSGWGGQLNVSYSQAVNSTTNGFPVTFDAYQSATSGSNFYISVLGQDASSLKYGTFMGGTTGSPNHVDGGTSRFDKSGRIYHAVCAACGGNANGFSSTPGAWSTTNQSNNCNLAAFKFELSSIDAVVANQGAVVCLPDPVFFTNNSANGNSFFWDFGDGTTSTEVNPVHMYPGTGDYTVNLLVSDTNNCYTSDSIEFEVHIGDFIGAASIPDTICPGGSTQLEATGGVTYAWSPGQFLSDSMVAMPIASVDQTTDFTVIISDTCGIDTVIVTLNVYDDQFSVIDDTVVCIGNSIDFYATGGGSYNWTPPTYLDNAGIANPECTPNVSTQYYVDIVSVNGCPYNDSVFVQVDFTPPSPVIPDSAQVCLGLSVSVSVSGASTYLWSPDSEINTLTGTTVFVSPLNDMYYYCEFTNACGVLMDSVFIDVVQANVQAGNDTTICPGETAFLWASGAVSYSWSPGQQLNVSDSSFVEAVPLTNTIYTVTGIDENGCIDESYVVVSLFTEPYITIMPGVVFADYGNSIELSASSSTSGPYVWSPPDFLSCSVCNSTFANPEQNFTYSVSVTDENGCSSIAYVQIYYDPNLYVPNTFTPDGDEYNNQFMVYLSEPQNVLEFHMDIFNRWGELIFETDDFNVGWDGTYAGKNCQDATYVWKIRLKRISNEETIHVGHVNLLR